jgi:hypothetical protein
MSLIAIGLNLLLATLITAALVLGWRLNGRLKALRDSHDGFARAVAELDSAARRAEQGLADLRAATDEATDALADRIEKARALTAKIDKQLDMPTPAPRDADRLGSLLSAAREPRETRGRMDLEPLSLTRRAPAPAALSRRTRPQADDDLFDEPEALGPLNALRGARR